jgi:hypothetical protein
MKDNSKLIISDSAFIAIKNKDLIITNYSDDMCGEGKYRVITKCQAGFMISSVKEAKSAIDVFRSYKIKAVHSIARVKEIGNIGEHDFMVYARAGKKVWIDEALLCELEVGDINQSLTNTALYSQAQYQAVNAKSWASKAYVMNEVEEMVNLSGNPEGLFVHSQYKEINK